MYAIRRSHPVPLALAASSFAVEIHHGHALLLRTGAVANALLEKCLTPNGIRPSGATLARAMAAQSMAGLSARLGEQLRAVRKSAGRLRARGIDPAALALPAQPRPERPKAPVRPKFHAAPGQFRGRLRHGNPAGDYLAAPRCGARTRSGCPCRQPAMANGRCRFHGGKSTGARTPEGLRRCRLNRFVHGGRSRPVLELRARAVQAARRLRHLNSGLRATLALAGHLGAEALRAKAAGVDRPDSNSAQFRCPLPSLPREISRGREASRWRREGGGMILAGHGVDRPDSNFHPLSSAPTAPTHWRPSTRREHLRSSVFIRGSDLSLAGHGVDRSDSVFPRPPSVQAAPTAPLRAA
jgi:hypothetical protein